MEKESDLVLLGDEAEELLQNNTFNKIVNQLVEETFQRFVNTKPESQTSATVHYTTGLVELYIRFSSVWFVMKL